MLDLLFTNISESKGTKKKKRGSLGRHVFVPVA
jgi:hypothetical protein